MLNRREMMHGVAAGAGAALGVPLLPERLIASPTTNATPKRIIFFLQNQGFDPKTCVPEGMNGSGSLAKAKLPEPISALEPYKERMHIINGLHGMHASPTHSAFFGALGGYRGGDGVPPSAATIDYALSKALPQTLLPHLCIGMDSIENMTSKPTIATLSASGAGQPIFMHSNPNQLYQMLYGGISTGNIRRQFEARSNVLNQIEKLAATKGRSLPATDQQRYGRFVQGFKDVNGLRDRLDTVASHLRKFAPKVDERYTKPEFETDPSPPRTGVVQDVRLGLLAGQLRGGRGGGHDALHDLRHLGAHVGDHQHPDCWFGSR